MRTGTRPAEQSEGPDMSLADDAALTEGLAVAVPLLLHDLALLSPAQRAVRIRVWAKDAVGPVASRGDALLFGGKRGEPAKVFNALAKGLAALAYCPGGVTFAGRHWCAAECDCPAGRGAPPDDAAAGPQEVIR
jgi:hypothetical protein